MTLPQLDDLDLECKEKYLEKLIVLEEKIKEAMLKLIEIIPLHIEESEIHYFIVHGSSLYHIRRKEQKIEPYFNDETPFEVADFSDENFFDNFIQKAKEAKAHTYLVYSPTPRLTIEEVLRYVEIDLGLIEE